MAYTIIFAVCLWMTILVAVILLILLLTIFAIISACWWLCHFIFDFISSHHIETSWLSHSNIHRSELNYITNAFPDKTSSRKIVINFNHSGRNLEVNTNVIVCASNIKRQSLIFVHGVGSSAVLMLSTTISNISKYFDIYSVDLPGFGRTTISDPTWLEQQNSEECLNFFNLFFDKLLTELDLDKPVIVAHSIGAYLTLMSLSNTDPSRLGGVILVNSAGILPVSNEHGAYLAWIFKLGVPMSIFRSLGHLSSIMYVPFTHLRNMFHSFYSSNKYNEDKISHTNKQNRTKYWYQIQASSAMVNIPSKFIKILPFKSYWKHPAFTHLLNCKCRIALIWSDNDWIFPVESAIFYNKICNFINKSFVLEVIKGDGHTPFHSNEGTQVVASIYNIMNKWKNEHISKLELGNINITNNELELHDEKWCSYYYTPLSRKVINDLYDTLWKNIEQKINSSM
jgi:pimeloyl-ACP methyl ester carboxylesterase